MELRHLRYFVAVAETLNFRAGAASLNLSTPGLSKQIKDLEGEIGVRLLERDTARVRLTNAGKVFLAEARDILALADRSIEMAREAQQGRRGRLLVGNIAPLTAHYMARCLTSFSARFPDVAVELIDLDVPGQIEALEQRRIQVGFIPAGSLGSLPAGLRHALVLTAPMRAVVGDEHRFAQRASISLAELATEKLLVVAGGKPSLHGSYIRTLLSGRGLEPRRIAEVQGFESLLAMIAGGQGVSLLAGRGNLLRVDNIVVRPLKETGSDLELEIHAVWQNDETAVLAENFLEAFRASIPMKRAAAHK